MPRFTPIDHDLEELKSHPGIIGCDEVGRGCLAGPIMACTVRITADSVLYLNEKAADSKKLSAAQRASAYVGLVAILSSAYVVNERSSVLVDSQGIQQCNKDIFSDGIKALVQDGDLVLVDGTLPKLHPNMRSLKKGESISVAIAAASIIAKVRRDGLMVQLDDVYPGYGFAKHKGYGTRAHIEALKRLGPCPIHRRTFIKNFFPLAS